MVIIFVALLFLPGFRYLREGSTLRIQVFLKYNCRLEATCTTCTGYQHYKNASVFNTFSMKYFFTLRANFTYETCLKEEEEKKEKKPLL